MESQTHLIVDGFNVAHAWGMGRRLSGRWVDEVASGILEELKDLHDTKGWRVTVVLDGQGNETDIQHPFGDESFSLLFSPASLTADAVIEQMVSGSERPEAIQVATRDRAVVHSVEASGAEAISPSALREEVKRIRRLKAARTKKSSDDAENAFGNRIPL